MRRQSQSDRFWSKVTPHGDGGCWIWLGLRNDGGYGLFDPAGGPRRVAHRVAWEERFGPIPAGLFLDHTCVQPACVNPEHLDPVTVAENNRRTRQRRALGEYRVACAKGHLLDIVGIRLGYGGSRLCRACASERDRIRRAGKVTCPICGAQRARSSMRRHIHRYHPTTLAGQPALATLDS